MNALRRNAALLLTIAFVGALGLMSHTRFSIAVGHPTFFANAFDEDTYFVMMARGLLGH
jgi:hypothetical protein